MGAHRLPPLGALRHDQRRRYVMSLPFSNLDSRCVKMDVVRERDGSLYACAVKCLKVELQFEIVSKCRHFFLDRSRRAGISRLAGREEKQRGEIPKSETEGSDIRNLLEKGPIAVYKNLEGRH